MFYTLPYPTHTHNFAHRLCTKVVSYPLNRFSDFYFKVTFHEPLKIDQQCRVYIAETGINA
jgi:hypothetical protein